MPGTIPREIVCGSDGVRAKVWLRPDGSSTLRCPICGREDEINEATRLATKYEAVRFMRSLFEMLASNDDTGEEGGHRQPSDEPRWRFVPR